LRELRLTRRHAASTEPIDAADKEMSHEPTQ
jgi:hypothetical protein